MTPHDWHDYRLDDDLEALPPWALLACVVVVAIIIWWSW